jgi:hypothetical protein
MKYAAILCAITSISSMIYGFYLCGADMSGMKSFVQEDIMEIRKEISELKNCVKDHHGRLCVIEEKK